MLFEIIEITSYFLFAGAFYFFSTSIVSLSVGGKILKMRLFYLLRCKEMLTFRIELEKSNFI